jgi:hypothetical protein
VTSSLDGRLTEWESRLDRLEAAFAPVSPNGSHLVFVPTPSGYGLVELDVLTAAAGEPIELEGRAYLVLRVSRSPLPGDPRRCAYVAAI